MDTPEVRYYLTEVGYWVIPEGNIIVQCHNKLYPPVVLISECVLQPSEHSGCI